LLVEDIYAAITGTLEDFPWEKPREIDLRDAELELMFRQVDSLLDGEPKDRVKSFIRFTLNEERRRRKQEKEAEECAAHILMPETELARVIDMPVWEIAEYFDVPEELACQRISEFATEEEVYHWQMTGEDKFIV